MAIDLSTYVEIKDRVKQFHATYPKGVIKTELLVPGPERFVVKAVVAKTAEECQNGAYFTGHAEEVVGQGYINKSSACENAETSAVGRALAFMGFSVDVSIASREEVERAIERQQTYDLEREQALNGMVSQMQKNGMKNSTILSFFRDKIGLDIKDPKNKKNFNPAMEQKAGYELTKMIAIQETGGTVLTEETNDSSKAVSAETQPSGKTDTPSKE